MNEKDEINVFALPLPRMSYMVARHFLTGHVGEHLLNPRLHQSRDMQSSDTGHPVTLVKADEEHHCDLRKTLETLPLRDLLLLLPIPCHDSAKPCGTHQIPTLPQRGWLEATRQRRKRGKHKHCGSGSGSV